ncbi:nephrin-like [Varroa jacobsoni]|uniref:Ig-like domain-containing protein n=1 Tax=Varroa destructor TaxID=109461 RepID=A0A7M7J828_VARDE|nr:nephrin-like [Varroa destructor]XP_022702652.1 nephrin-like [Varroa jacobsoni]XP_022702653.1 nephrin-like [Varroa jacobsoni]
MLSSSHPFPQKIQQLYLRLIVIYVYQSSIVRCEQNSDQQYFKVRPQSVQLIEGQTTELQCHIGNLGGQVQWSKDGFVLGYESVIPGFPRYQMVIDEPRGIYNLRLNQVTLDDEAEYQCQVGPVPDHQAIWAAAYVTVLVPPKQIELRHRGGNDSKVVEAREGEQTTLSCWVRDTKPPANIRWYRNNQLFDKEKVHRRVDTNGDRELSSIFTKVEIYPRHDDSRAAYTCEAQHPALKAPLRASLVMSVLYPPGEPEIHGQPETQLQSGDTLTLACLSRGGNPPARLDWFRNDVSVRSRYRQGTHEATATHSVVLVDRDDGAVFRCDASNSVTHQPLSTAITIHVTPHNRTRPEGRRRKRKKTD